MVCSTKNAQDPYLLPGLLIGEGDEDVAGRLEGANNVILDQNSGNQSGI